MNAVWRFLQFFGAACLIIVVLTHVAEALHLFPDMGWGQPNSVGHYLDLVSAILGCTLVPLGFLGSAFIQRKRHYRKQLANSSFDCGSEQPAIFMQAQP
jgi:formate hydrogenlyase subunit 3/multisubunit Na+/H+ antiporter MnhD subunit